VVPTKVTRPALGSAPIPFPDGEEHGLTVQAPMTVLVHEDWGVKETASENDAAVLLPGVGWLLVRVKLPVPELFSSVPGALAVDLPQETAKKDETMMESARCFTTSLGLGGRR